MGERVAEQASWVGAAPVRFEGDRTDVDLQVSIASTLDQLETGLDGALQKQPATRFLYRRGVYTGPGGLEATGPVSIPGMLRAIDATLGAAGVQYGGQPQ